MRTLLLAAAAALLATGVQAQPVRSIQSTQAPGANLTPEEKAKAEAEGTLICKMVKVTGSRLRGGKVCQSAEQIAARKAEDKQALERLQGQRSRCDPGSC